MGAGSLSSLSLFSEDIAPNTITAKNKAHIIKNCTVLSSAGYLRQLLQLLTGLHLEALGKKLRPLFFNNFIFCPPVDNIPLIIKILDY